MWWGSCAYRGLRDALYVQQERKRGVGYNEIVLDVAALRVDAVPRQLEAWFYLAGGKPRSAVEPVHGRFLAAYGLSAQEVPLVRLDLAEAAGDAPFSLG